MRGRALRLALAALCPLGVLLELPAAAAAQGPAYGATPPTKGALYRDGPSGRYLLGGGWLSRVDLGDVGIAQGFWRDTASTDGFSPVTVPNSYNANDLSPLSMSGYVGWYRRDFTLPAGAFKPYVKAGQRYWLLHFDSVNYRATAWLNGRELGTHAGAYLPWELTLRGLRAGVNRLVIRVDDRRTGSEFPPGPSGGWWNFGGILGDVYLRTVQRVDISRVQVRPLLKCPSCAATVQEQLLVRNLTGTRQRVVLTGTYGRARIPFGSAVLRPHGSWTAQALVSVAHPRLWAPDSPSLYRAGFTLRDDGGHALSSYTTYSGIRSIKVLRGGTLELNGRRLDLRGFSIHEQATGYGAALDLAQMQRLIGWARELGATIIRAHYPLSPEIEEMADRDGLLLWSEVPVYQTQEPYMQVPSWRTRAWALLKQNILTNQNHPSVLLWSIGNELPSSTNPGESAYIAGAVARAHELDPTRPVGMAVGAWPGLRCQAQYRPLDVIGYNDYFGWFDAGGGTTDDRDALSGFLDSFHACYRGKAIFITEFGAEGNRHGPVEERGTYEFQSNAAEFHLGVYATKPWLAGAIWFPLQDFAARPGWDGADPLGDPPYVQKGPVDLQGNFKPVFSVLQSIYRDTVQIAPRR